MSQLLDPSCKTRLVEVLSLALSKIKVNNNRYIDRSSTIYLFSADDTIPKTGKIRQALEAYIDESPVFEFVYEALSKRLGSAFEYSLESTNQLLTTFAGFEDTNALASALVEELDSLPWTYDLTLVLPDTIGIHFATNLPNEEFSESVKIVNLDGEFKETYPLHTEASKPAGNFTSLLGSLLDDKPRWPAAQAGLKVRTKGFIGIFGLSEPALDALGRSESFLGVCLALNLLKASKKYHHTRPKIPVFVHREIGDTWIEERRFELDYSQSQTIEDIELSDAASAATPPQLSGYFRYVGDRLKVIFSSNNSSRILSAAKWLLNSYGSNDAMLSFVQATVVLEILLGEQTHNEKVGLTELLRNRCAYLIAHTAEEREEIKSEFSEIYAVRSKIVHTGKSKLSAHEGYLLSQLRQYGCRAIRREIELLMPQKVRP